MILYLDSSALAKRYLVEEGSTEVQRLIAGAEQVGTSVIARVEVVVALGRARRQKFLDDQPAARLRALFTGHWLSFVRLSLGENTIERAEALAWELALRGYDAVHLASALAWREAIAEAPLFSTFDLALCKGGPGQRPRCGAGSPGVEALDSATPSAVMASTTATPSSCQPKLKGDFLASAPGEP